MQKILAAIKKQGADLDYNGALIGISLSPPDINPKTISLLYYLINNFEDSYFITFKNIPYCLMPDALEHIIHEHTDTKQYHYDRLCSSCHLKPECLGWNNLININRNTLSHIKRIPKEIIFEVTKKCNLGCINCTDQNKGLTETDLKSVKHVINESVRLGIRNIRFTGGEPLLHSQIEEMIVYAKKYGLYVTLNTNATLFDDRLIESVGGNTDNILVSMQGFNEESERLLTKDASLFRSKLTNILKLRRKCKGVLRLGTVITETLINHFGVYVRLIKKLGIDDWELYRPIVAEHWNRQVAIKYFQVITDKISKLRYSGLKIKIGNPLPFCINKDMRLSKLFFLGGIPENSRLVIDATGYFKPSYFINYNLGRQLKKSWKKLLLLNAASQKNLPLRCQKCKSLKWCKGGFRMMRMNGSNIAFLNDPLAPKY